MTNQRTLSQRLRCVDPMDQWSSIEERCNLAADELDRLSRIEIKYDNLCPVLNEQAGEIERLRAELAASPRVMIHEHWNAPYTGSPDEPQETPK